MVKMEMAEFFSEGNEGVVEGGSSVVHVRSGVRGVGAGA